MHSLVHWPSKTRAREATGTRIRRSHVGLNAIGGAVAFFIAVALLLAIVSCTSNSPTSSTSPKSLPPRELVLVDAKTGAVNRDFPDIDTEDAVLAAVADGSGGWYIGGGFKLVGKVPRNGLARLRSDGSLDLEFAPRLPRDAAVVTIARHGSVVYVGGVFEGGIVGGVAAFDARSGRRLWQFSIPSLYQINALAFANGALYVAGNFVRIGGVARNAIAALDPRTGKPTAWRVNFSTSASVTAFAIDHGIVYLAGGFDAIDGAKRESVSRLSAPARVK